MLHPLYNQAHLVPAVEPVLEPLLFATAPRPPPAVTAQPLSDGHLAALPHAEVLRASGAAVAALPPGYPPATADANDDEQLALALAASLQSSAAVGDDELERAIAASLQEQQPQPAAE